MRLPLSVGEHDEHSLVFLTCTGSHTASKTWRGSPPVVIPYNAGFLFNAWHVPAVRTIGMLAAALAHIAADPKAFVIRGAPAHDLRGPVARRKVDSPATEKDGVPGVWLDCPRHFIPIDVDKHPLSQPYDLRDRAQARAAVAELVGTLGPEFQNVSYYAMLSASAGMGDPREISCRVWFMSDRLLTEDELKNWREARASHVDAAVWRAVQPVFTASPVFEDGAIDPISERGWLVEHARQAVALGHYPKARRADREIVLPNIPTEIEDWARAAAERRRDILIKRIRNAPAGEARNPVNHAAAWELGGYAAAGLIDALDTLEALIAAAVEADRPDALDEDRAEREIESSFERGMLSPKTPRVTSSEATQRVRDVFAALAQGGDFEATLDEAEKWIAYASISGLDLTKLRERMVAALKGKVSSPARAADGVLAKAGSALTAEASAEGESEHESAVRRAFRGKRSHDYTPEELRAMAPLEKRWLLACDDGHHVRVLDDYQGPFSRENVATVCRDLLAPARSAGVELENDLGVKGPAELDHDYGSVPLAVAYDMTVKRSTFDGWTFTRRAAPVLDLAPRRDPQIEEWLRLLGGEEHERLLDWLATVTDLSRPSSALMLLGTPGVGKNLIAEGCARLWGKADPTTFETAVSQYNARLRICPLIFADEHLAIPFGEGNAADHLKKLITSNERPVADKYVRSTPLRGAVRVIIGANNRLIMRFGRQLSPNDIEALNERIILIEPAAGAADYLKSIGGRETTTPWVEEGLLAQHVLWLRGERPVKAGARFAVQGNGKVGHLLVSDGIGTGPLLRWICAAVASKAVGRAIESRAAEAVDKDEDGVWVHPTAVREHWKTFSRGADEPEDWEGAFSVVCHPAGRRNRKRVGDERVRMRLVRDDYLAMVREGDGTE